MTNRDAEITYYDNGYHSITVTRNRYGRLKEFHNAINELMKSIFTTTSTTKIDVYYNQYKRSVTFTRKQILENAYYNIYELRKARNYEEEK